MRIAPWLLASLAVPVCLAAQETEQPKAFAKDAPYQLVVDQLNGDIDLRDTHNKRIEHWPAGARRASTALASVPHNRPLLVRLTNANSLLYRYEVTSTAAARGGIKSCVGLGDRLASTGVFTALVTMPGQAQNSPINPQMVAPPTRGEEMGTVSRESMEAVATQLRSQVRDYSSSLARLKALPAMIDDSLATIAEMGESLPIEQLLSDLQKSIERMLPGVHSASDVQLVVRQSRNQPVVATLDRYADVIRSRKYEGDSSDAPAAEILNLSAQVNQAIRDAIPSMRALQSRLVRIEAAKAAATQDFTLDASNDYRRIVIQAIPTTEFSDVPRLRAGRKELFSKPVATFVCEVSVGMAFMNAPPRYAIESGKLIDRDASEERTAPQFLAHVASNRLPWIAALGGLGFGGQARPDFYLGGTFRALSPVLFNFGAVWQRVDRLNDGMKIGQQMSDASALSDLPRKYKSGFFWGFSFGR